MIASEVAPARQVDPAAIERELSALWRAEGEAQAKSSADGKTFGRTLLFNLIILSPDQASADRAREDVVALTPRQPARSITVVAKGDAKVSGPEQPIEAWVSLVCTTPQPGAEITRVCGELITVEAKGPSIFDLPGTVLPLLLTNLPTFLWWQSGNPFAHPIFKDLTRAVDRVILDSLTFTAPERDFADVARVIAASEARFSAIITDLGWSRLAPWRALTAQIFDPQAMRPYLNQLERITITYYQGSPAVAWLFAGWLASRLRWKLVSRDSAAMRFEGGQTIEFQAIPIMSEDEEQLPGHFAEVELRTREGATFFVARRPESCAVTRLDVGGMKTENVVPVRYETSAEALGRELNRLTRSTTFEAAVSLITQRPSTSS
jgi:glucose-6-phosphate dehydrogenase assembly protein OpcA